LLIHKVISLIDYLFNCAV